MEDVLDPQIELVQLGVTLSLVTEHPNIVTPTGIDVDDDGQIWAVASHTHFRPKDYQGPAHDEVIVISGGSSGRTVSRRVFYNETDSTMDLELGPDGWVYLAERDRILRVRDSDGDGRADQQEDLAVLATEADYPHNGLSGLAWHPSGDLVFALGENYWRDWTLTSTDMRTITGTGEGGVFRCRPDGSQLRRIARGFWNPFGLCVREDGTMFAAENDPGAMPPCRLLQIVEGGDYGYQRLYGSAPYHPFVCWNGELRGTLPMLHAVGEAPCGIASLANGLVVPSWAEHRIDFYPLSANGASFKTERVTLVRGGPNFRPTCITQISPTVFYLTDWVYGSYDLHGRGRIWKIEIDPSANWLGDLEFNPPNEHARQAADLLAGSVSYSQTQLLSLARSSDPFMRHAAIFAISKRTDKFTEKYVDALDTEDQISLLLALRRSQPKSVQWVRYFWNQVGDEIRFETLRWIADEQLKAFHSDVDALLDQPEIRYRIFEAALATSNVLSGNADSGIADKKMAINRVTDPKASAKIRSFALRLLDVNEKVFGPGLWKELYDTGDPALIAELARALGSSGSESAVSFLLQIANNEKLSPSIRADAIAGVPGTSESNSGWLVDLVDSNEATLREEALRSLRFTKLDSDAVGKLRRVAILFPESADLVEAAIDPSTLNLGRPEPTDTRAWQSRLGVISQPVDLAAGRRIFHHAAVGACSKCHRHDGRGNVVGPDLSAVSNDGNPDRLLQALLEPSRDIDPQYFPRMLVTEDGHVFTGLLLRDGGGGREFYRDNAGREQSFNTADIVQRKELHASMMPGGLIDLMTDREIRDLIAFLDASEKNHSGQQRAGQQRAGQGHAFSADDFVGVWWLDFSDGYGGWLSVQQSEDGLSAKLLWRVGSTRMMNDPQVENGKLVMVDKRKGDSIRYEASLDGEWIRVTQTGNDVSASGKRCPPMPPRPDLARVKFGPPVELFNGRNLDGWQLQPANAKNGWSVQDGELVNETPKTDFGAYGSYGNLRTTNVFGDCQLHVEFNIDAARNSGIYVRGLYEAQVVDRDSPMQGINGPGAIFGRVEPSKNAGLDGGRWQTYDITLVDRHLTVELNGERVIDNQPVDGCTGGALFGDVTRDGPLYLQGDHTSVKYRNLRLRPRISG